MPANSINSNNPRIAFGINTINTFITNLHTGSTGALNIGNTSAGAVTINGSSAGLTINSATGALAVSNDAAATTVNIATGAAIKTLTLGSTNSTSASTLQSGSGALNITSTNGAMTMNSGTGAINISSDATTTTVNIGVAPGPGVKTVTVGCIQGTSTTNLQASSGGIGLSTQSNGPISLQPNGSGAVNISTLGALTGTVSIATGTGAQTINIATGAAPKTTTLGSTNTTSTTTIQSGSNPLTLTTNGGNANIVLTPNGTGRVTTAKNINAAGISFDSGTTTMSAYAIGTWTCTITGSGSNPTISYSSNTGNYIKIGRLVVANMYLQISSVSGGSGNVVLNGLPFTVGNDSARAAITISGPTFSGSPYLFTNTNVTTMGIQFSNSAGTPTSLAVSALTSSTYFQFTVTYISAS